MLTRSQTSRHSKKKKILSLSNSNHVEYDLTSCKKQTFLKIMTILSLISYVWGDFKLHSINNNKYLSHQLFGKVIKFLQKKQNNNLNWARNFCVVYLSFDLDILSGHFWILCRIYLIFWFWLSPRFLSSLIGCPFSASWWDIGSRSN